MDENSIWMQIFSDVKMLKNIGKHSVTSKECADVIRHMLMWEIREYREVLKDAWATEGWRHQKIARIKGLRYALDSLETIDEML